MPKFKIEEKELVVEVFVYEVEAESPEEALDKYCNELAGSLTPVETYQEAYDPDEFSDEPVAIEFYNEED